MGQATNILFILIHHSYNLCHNHNPIEMPPKAPSHTGKQPVANELEAVSSPGERCQYFSNDKRNLLLYN